MATSGVPLKKGDDLFNNSSMSFGAHLEELRKCLIWAMGYTIVGMLVGLLVAESVVNYVQTPLENALRKYYADRAEAIVSAKGGGLLSTQFKQFLIQNDLTAELIFQAPATETTDVEVVEREFQSLQKAAEAHREKFKSAQNANDESSELSREEQANLAEDAETLKVAAEDALRDHKSALIPLELRKFDAPRLSMLKPYWRIEKNPETNQALGLQEPFMIWLKAAFVVGVVLASPGIFHSVWTFVAAGLYPHERRYVYFFLPFALGLFLSGVGLAFFFIFEIVIDFLLKFNSSLGIAATPRLADYMSFALFLPLGFGIAFQLPLVMLAMERIGLITVETYLKQWRMAIVIITVISMVLTPAEVTSMIGMAVPLIGLYFVGVALCHYFPRRGFAPETGYDPQ